MNAWLQGVRLFSSAGLVLLAAGPVASAANLTSPQGGAAPSAAPALPGLQWDAMEKDYTAKTGEATNLFTFSATNVSTHLVYIEKLTPSCGCTVAKLPEEPWRLDTGSNGQVHITINFAGKYGLVTKFIRVDGWEEVGEGSFRQTNRLTQNLIIRVHLPEGSVDSASVPAPSRAASTAPPVTLTSLATGPGRTRNVEMAKADRQAVFKGECATCHAIPSHGKQGEELFQSACAICHESSHRAAMVPDLAVVKPNTKRNQAYWLAWITSGRAGTLMPAFSNEPQLGGPLTSDQIDHLAAYLTIKYPSE